MTQQTIKRLPTWLWLAMAIWLAFALRLYRLDAQSLWFDEIVIVALGQQSWYQSLIAALGQGMQLTPVFHGLIKLWLPVGDSDWLVRMPAVILGTLTIPVVYQAGRFFFSRPVGLLAAFIFAINPYQVWYGQELKLYVLLPLAASGAMVAFGQLVKSRGRRGLGRLIFFNLMGLPAHYFLFLISTVQFLYLAITFKRNHGVLRRWVLAQIIGVFPLLLWWLFIIIQQRFTVGIGWIPAPAWYAPLLTLWNFTFVYTGQMSPLTAVALLATAAGLLLGLRRAWQQPKGWGLLLLLWLLFPPLIAWLMSYGGKLSFYIDRYLLIVSPVLILLIVSGFLSIRWPAVRAALLLVFLLATGLGLWRIFFDPANFSKEDWRALAQTLDRRAEPDHLVITCTDGQWLALEYYNPHRTLAAENVLFSGQLNRVSPSDQTAWVVDVHAPLGLHYLAKTAPPPLDRSLLTPAAAAWDSVYRGETVTAPSISAYRYDISDQRHLPEIVDWHCSN